MSHGMHSRTTRAPRPPVARAAGERSARSPSASAAGLASATNAPPLAARNCPNGYGVVSVGTPSAAASATEFPNASHRDG